MRDRESTTYFVRYRDVPQPKEDFVDYYRRRHADILLQWPGIKSLILHVPAVSNDPFPVVCDCTDFLAEIVFESAEALDRALQSKARAEARDDFVNLKRGDVVVTHQAMRSLKLL